MSSPEFQINQKLIADSFHFYNELTHAIPPGEREEVIAELERLDVIERARRLVAQLAAGDIVGTDMAESRLLFLAALRALRDKQISVNQLASLHILDSAIRTLYVNPMMYMVYTFVNADNELHRQFYTYALTNLQGLPTALQSHRYDLLPVPCENMSIKALPLRMQQPLMRRFFNFTASEWDSFCRQCADLPKSEQQFVVLNAPEQGCWSPLIFRIQNVLKCMQVLDWLKDSQEGPTIEKIMLVPSFSMFQAAINAKAETLGRQPVTLVPTYGYLAPKRYLELKRAGLIALAMYLPEQDIDERYQNECGRFRTTVDGHPKETAFAGAIHDVYHAFREMMMTENVAKARFRLADIARRHPKNKRTDLSRPVDDILVDGELIYCYPLERDTIFNPLARGGHQRFGDIFYTPGLAPHLDATLKTAFIQDMVEHADLWREEYDLGRDDLTVAGQYTYNELLKASRLQALVEGEERSPAQLLKQQGVLANHGTERKQQGSAKSHQCRLM